MNPRIAKIVFFIALCWFGPRLALASIEITLDNAFIDKLKDRVTIDASFTVDKAHAHPNPGTKDGDLHIAGRADEVKLPMVSEIMNAASRSEVVDIVHGAEASTTNRTLPVTGVWRLWCEHGGETQQIQGKALPKRFTTTNPEHVFQLHPLIRVGSSSLLDTIHLVQDYTPKEAELAFNKYESISCHIDISSKKKTTIVTTMAGFNYVDFLCRPTDKPQQLADGTAVFAEARTLDDEVKVFKRRMLFIKDSAAEQAFKALGENQELHVLGIPRISLKLIAWRRDHASQNKNMLDWGLPYEIVIVDAREARAATE